MRTRALLLTAILLCGAAQAIAQCTPDPQYTNTGIYPQNLPPATAGVPYSETITVVVPADTNIMGMDLTIVSNTLDAINGLPAGFSYTCNPPTCVFPGGSTGCVLITGNPTENQVGTYPVDIDVTANVQLVGNVPLNFDGFSLEVLPGGGGGNDPCTDWVSPSPTSGWNDFVTMFGSAPCDDGSGCAVQQITDFEVWQSEAYVMANLQAGGSYTFSHCTGPGAGSWTPEYTIVSPSAVVVAFGAGNGDGCSITFTATEAGSYLIVINQAGACGVGAAVDNGYPTFTCNGNAPCPVEQCEAVAGTLTAVPPTFVCLENGTATLSATPNGNQVVPQGFLQAYGLTQAPNQVIVDFGAQPSFTVNAAGTYTIHSFVYDPTTLNPANLQLGITTAGMVNAMLIQGGGDICASLDLTGVTLTVSTCDFCQVWVNPSPTGGWTDFNGVFGGAPCNDGSGCPVYIIDDFEVWQSEAYAIDNFIAGGTYTFSHCTGPGAGSWVPDYTIYGPDGTVVASGAGDGDGCSITFTATVAGTYLIVINEAGQCGVEGFVDNGYPSITCVSNAPCPVADPCLPGTITSTAQQNVCPGQNFQFNVSGQSIPAGGGYGLAFEPMPGGAGGPNAPFTLSGVTLPLAANAGLNGALAANSLPDLSGAWMIYGFTYTNGADPLGSLCDFTVNEIIVSFLSANDPICQGGGTCTANAGTISAQNAVVCLEGGQATLVAIPGGSPVVPQGFQTAYVLTQGAGLTVLDVQPVPTFTVGALGNYTIHTLIFDPLTAGPLLAATTGFQVNELLIQGGGSICGALIVQGAAFSVEFCGSYCPAWSLPTPVAGWNDFNVTFGGAPCDADGTGCPVNQISTFEVQQSEAYALNNVQAGINYTFSHCTGPNAGSWVPDYTIFAPNGTVDASGPGSGCSISWTASQSGTYLIVINRAGFCGQVGNQGNGYPSLTCSGAPPCPLGVDELGTVAFDLYPNPSTGMFTVSVPNVSGEVRIDVLDVNGRTVRTVSRVASNGLHAQMDMSGTAQGLYMVRVSGHGFSELRKLVIQ